MDGDPLFAVLPDEWNALRATTEDGRVFTARGRGAGRIPTAESLWADVGDLAGDPKKTPPAPGDRRRCRR